MKANIKPAFGHDRVKLHEVVPLDTPFTINIASATVCNFKCKFCVHSLGSEKFKEINFKPAIMKWDIFCKICEQIKAFPRPIKAITLYGNGEPLCNMDLPKMVAYLKKIDKVQRVEFITNGSLLDEKTSLDLINAGLDTIRISIEGLTSEKYKEVCGVKIDFQKLVNEIRFFYKNKKNCNVFIKALDITLDQVEEDKFYNIFLDISDRVFVEKVMPVFHGVDYSDMIRNNTVMDRYGNAHERRIVCPMCFFTLSVWPNGDIYPCDVLSDPAGLGNIRDISLVGAWNGNKRKEFLKMQLSKKRMENDVCKNCCAPDDVSQPEDELDQYADELLKRFA